jgi:hypothetical protein
MSFADQPDVPPLPLPEDDLMPTESPPIPGGPDPEADIDEVIQDLEGQADPGG